MLSGETVTMSDCMPTPPVFSFVPRYACGAKVYAKHTTKTVGREGLAQRMDALPGYAAGGGAFADLRGAGWLLQGLRSVVGSRGLSFHRLTQKVTVARHVGNQVTALIIDRHTVKAGAAAAGYLLGFGIQAGAAAGF